MKLGYQEGRITCDDLEVRPVVLENVGGLTEKAVSEIVRNANIGEQVVKMMDGQKWGFWDVCNLVKALQNTVEQERGEHWMRCREAKMSGTHFGQILGNRPL